MPVGTSDCEGSLSTLVFPDHPDRLQTLIVFENGVEAVVAKVHRLTPCDYGGCLASVHLSVAPLALCWRLGSHIITEVGARE